MIANSLMNRESANAVSIFVRLKAIAKSGAIPATEEEAKVALKTKREEAAVLQQND